ncbi:MAG: thrombospondin type 3 repeat-containing protein, partial [Bdellovibrionales bacterium]
LGYNSVSKTKSPAVRNVYRAYSGLDALGKRFDLATKILEDMKGGSPNTQVMIVPISGGVAQSKLFGVVAPQFVSIDVAIGRVQALKEEQLRNATEGQRAGDEWRYEKRTMGTTAPNDVLRGYHDPDKNMYYYNEYDDLGDSGWMRRPSIYQMIENEMIILRRQKKLPRATFSVLMLTDGRVTPSPKDIENARELLGCPSATSCPYNSVFSQFWGDADLNTKEELKSTVEDFLSLPARKFENEGMVKFDIIDLNAYAQDTKLFPPEWEADPEKSPFFQELTLPGFAVWRLLGDSKEETNYRAGSVPKDPTVLEVRQVYVLNLNVRAKGDGSKCVDSDADGLCDSEESAAGTSPTELRTNGFCMDSIYTRFTDSCDAMAAQRLCDPNMDFDGDSLNSCEESLIGTSNFDFDSDDDEIPDYLAWLYGFSPTSSLRNTDSNGDGISDLMNFKAGLGPNMDYKSIPEAVKSTYTSNEIPYRVDNGRWATIREIHISHLPTAFLLPLSGGEVSGYGFTDESGNPIPSNLILPTYSTSGDLNKFIVLAKVIDSTNPRNVWWYLHNGSFNLHTRTLPDLIRLSNLNQIVMALDPQDLK